jgi:DNA-binding XRE family transcriptional regulator
MQANMLKGKLAENGMTQAAAAEKIGISFSRFNAKINETRGAEFSLGEVLALKNVLNLSPEQIDQIFFT